jgi:hypothetical protein
VHARYRFSILSVNVGEEKLFQIGVALADDSDAELIPAHQSAFAQIIPLKQACTTAAEAEMDLRLLTEWLEERVGDRTAHETTS